MSVIKLIGTAYRRDDFTTEEPSTIGSMSMRLSRPDFRGDVVSEVVRKLGGWAIQRRTLYGTPIP